jgi:hypothetical protein
MICAAGRRVYFESLCTKQLFYFGALMAPENLSINDIYVHDYERVNPAVHDFADG